MNRLFFGGGGGKCFHQCWKNLCPMRNNLVTRFSCFVHIPHLQNFFMREHWAFLTGVAHYLGEMKVLTFDGWGGSYISGLWRECEKKCRLKKHIILQKYIGKRLYCEQCWRKSNWIVFFLNMYHAIHSPVNLITCTVFSFNEVYILLNLEFENIRPSACSKHGGFVHFQKECEVEYHFFQFRALSDK